MSETQIYSGADWTLIEDDCLKVMGQFEENSIDSIVTDPPYELGFMGKGWDSTGIAFHPETWAAVLRVLKPGGYLLAFGGSRTFHRIACAIEDAGFEIRDTLSWMYGTGFPKSLDVSKAIDAAAGATREVVGQRTTNKGDSGAQQYAALGVFRQTSKVDVTAPSTDAARRWEGWGTALKPAWEPVIMARKPLGGTVAANVQKWGTGALNIDGCRIESESGGRPARGAHQARPTDSAATSFDLGSGMALGVTTQGRWPANVLLDEEAAAALDAQTGTLKSGAIKAHHVRTTSKTKNTFGERAANPEPPRESSEGGASRFFYVAKASRSERDAGCEALPARSAGEATDRGDDTDGLSSPRAGAGRTGGARNIHPTVKPVELMRWLVRLVTPPGGCVFDPFAGSGSTGVAAIQEGFVFGGCEREPEYTKIAVCRLTHAQKRS